LASLKSFQQLIEDAQAMLAGTFSEQLDQNVARAPSPAQMPVSENLPPNAESNDATAFDPTEFGNFSFDFGAADADAADADKDKDKKDKDDKDDKDKEVAGSADADRPPEPQIGTTPDSFPAPTVSTADVLKFLIDRTGYIKLLEDEDTPEAFSRIENLRELVNAAMDSRDRAETLDQFLDHAALVADADDYDARAQITLMSLHAAKGLEFPLIFLSGLEEGLFPHSRTMLVPEDIEEERRLCYVGMTRAMDQLILTRAVYRRRYGTDLPEASVPSRFLEEVPAPLIEELGSRSARTGTAYVGTAATSRQAGRSLVASESTHYSYEDEDQSAAWSSGDNGRGQTRAAKATAPARPYNSIENIAEFFASRGKKFTVPKTPVEEPTGKRGFRPGQKVRHPKYGEGTVYQREGEGEEAKITVQFPRFGLKKLVEKYAQLERA
jgi:DNA helicase-2/ATP-dependent DNA helicase PcrA